MYDIFPIVVPTDKNRKRKRDVNIEYNLNFEQYHVIHQREIEVVNYGIDFADYRSIYSI